ncbi:L-aspartate oxidase [Pseudarthrobacter sp. J1763]|uniref:L-aspartate oxidase n=1 Tax=Pseudarthrobacter sp. J1763 TaxID=3420445 RepID=UPI003D27A684
MDIRSRDSAGAGVQRRRLVVVGSGIAGLYSALLAAEGGAEVVLLSKGELRQSNTYFAQGGISAVLAEPSPGDTVAAHIADTLRAGAGHCSEEAVRVLCTEAREDIAGLARFGVHFDTDDDGRLALGLEAAHSAPRILHAGGDATGAGVASALVEAVLAAAQAGRLTVLAHAQVTRLVLDAGAVTGVEFLHAGVAKEILCDAVLLASGGAGQLFAQTTNPLVATADGLALAWRAGAEVSDLEFFQFHPTAMVPAGEGSAPLLISEAVRGEGAVLLDSRGTRFMPSYHADAELAPRDVVSRSIALHLDSLGDPAGHVFLDARGIEAQRGSGFLARRFPTLTKLTLAAGLDWTQELIPVAPAAHYWMGGVVTDLHGRTNVPGLLAAGEVACTGVHGANRLASNSLLEGLVFGRRAVGTFLASSSSASRASFDPAPLYVNSADCGLGFAHAGGTLPDHEWAVAPGADERKFSRSSLRQLMTTHVGVLRDGVHLREAADLLAAWAAGEEPQDPEDSNLLLAAQLMVRAAQERQTSLGAHYRHDSLPQNFASSPERRYTYCKKASLIND